MTNEEIKEIAENYFTTHGEFWDKQGKDDTTMGFRIGFRYALIKKVAPLIEENRILKATLKILEEEFPEVKEAIDIAYYLKK